MTEHVDQRLFALLQPRGASSRRPRQESGSPWTRIATIPGARASVEADCGTSVATPFNMAVLQVVAAVAFAWSLSEVSAGESGKAYGSWRNGRSMWSSLAGQGITEVVGVSL